jgi:carboxyl-terminal processing protease
MVIRNCTFFLIFLFSGIIIGDIKGQESLIDSVIYYGRTTSVMRDSVNWNELEVAMRIINEEEGLGKATSHMLRELGDFHGRIWIDDVPYFGVSKGWAPSNMKIDSLNLAMYQQTSAKVHASLLNGNFGYLRVPGVIYREDNLAEATSIYSKIDSLGKIADIQGWVVDLRLNGGGTMYPMLAGLAPLLGNQVIGAFEDPATNYRDEWSIKDGELYIGEYQSTDYGFKGVTDMAHLPVVVLISGFTASSGEVVAISFKERPKTIFIGENTAAYTTAVSWIVLSESVVLQLTESYYADRLGNIYPGTSVPPDIQIDGGDDFYNLENDVKIQKAIEWLEAQ